MKKKMRLIYISVTVISIICVAVAAFLVKDFVGELGVANNSTNSTQDEDAVILYSEPKNPTELQKEIYQELLEATAHFPEEYEPFDVAALVVKSFVADFYTWTNKDGNFDVGGLDYVYGPNHLTFALYARDTFYQNFNFFEQEYGVENLIEVESINIRAVNYAANVVIGETEYRSYYVEAFWDYKENDCLDVSKFQDNAYYIVMYNTDNGRFEIANTFEITWEVAENE